MLPQPVSVFVDEDALLVGQSRHHAGSFHLYRLVQEDDDEDRNSQRERDLAQPLPRAYSSSLQSSAPAVGSSPPPAPDFLLIHLAPPSIFYSIQTPDTARCRLAGLDPRDIPPDVLRPPKSPG